MRSHRTQQRRGRVATPRVTYDRPREREGVSHRPRRSNGPQTVHPRTMLLGAVKGELAAWELVVDLAGDVALEASHGFFLGAAFVEAAGEVGAGSLVAEHSRDDDVPERRVGLSVAAAVEAVSFLLPLPASIGATPHRCANVASLRRRSGFSPAATNSAVATSVPTPLTATSSAAVSATSVLRILSISVISYSRAIARRARVRNV